MNAPINPQSPTFRGLFGVTSVGRLEVHTTFREAYQSADFLESLVVDNYGNSTAEGLESLREVDGRFSWGGTDLYDISALAHLETVGGDLELPLDVTSLAGSSSAQITNNSPLTNCQANSLLNSMTIPSTTTQTVYGNGSPCLSLSRAVSSNVRDAATSGLSR